MWAVLLPNWSHGLGLAGAAASSSVGSEGGFGRFAAQYSGLKEAGPGAGRAELDSSRIS